MGFFDGLLDTLTFGAYGAVSDLLSTPTQVWSENRSVNNSKELIDHQTGRTKELQQHQADLGKDVFDYTFGKEASLNQQMMENSPSVQKQAMISAGINPASNFGTFSGNLAQSSAPAYSASAGSAFVPSSVGAGLKIAELAMQKPLIEAEARLKNVEADQKERSFPSIIRGLSLDNRKKVEEWKRLQLTNEEQKIRNKWLDLLNEEDWKKKCAETDLLDEQSLTEQKRRAVMDSTIAELLSRSDYNYSNIAVNRFEIAEKIANIYYTSEKAAMYYDETIAAIKQSEAYANLSEQQQANAAVELLLSSKDLEWFEYNKVLEGVKAGTDVARAVADVKRSSKRPLSFSSKKK